MNTEILVIGGGPGGYNAAFRSADLGKKVTLVEERDTLGGVCLNAGCIPSKTLLHLAEHIVHSSELNKYGVLYKEPELDFNKIRKHRDSVVNRLAKGLRFLSKKRKVEIVKGTAVFTSPDTVYVKTGSEEIVINFKQCIIAAGSRPVTLKGVPQDSEQIWDSTDALMLKSIPEKLLIIGGGIIGVEMAAIYSSFGSQVTVIEMLDRIIPPAEMDIVKIIEKKLKRMGIKIHAGTKVESVISDKDGVKVLYNGKEEIFNAALLSVGRVPNSDLLNIKTTGVETDEKGFIPVDETQKTNVPHIFAIGDITAGPMLAHKAAHQGKAAAESAAGLKSAFVASAIPSVIYTFPEAAWTGISEKTAVEKGIKYIKGIFPWQANGRSLSQGSSDGLTKLIFDSETERIIGGAVVGPHAGELISEITLAVEMGADMADISHTIHPHPTFSETICLAAEAAL